MPSVDATEASKGRCSAEANFSRSTSPGPAALSSQLQVSRDSGFILVALVHGYSASSVRDGASLFTRIWDIPFSQQMEKEAPEQQGE
ncbi:hypothetical protein J1605_013419 [Eschrichtius robustus]|uniref:Uncharacterized protein n=1 Tax=Eschrichtius robustus TaxID=9764 RepID=A0AB34GEX7_ESCRO|nr:hypothetical protein J1605_013419 [Eschrichtius robustus]